MSSAFCDDWTAVLAAGADAVGGKAWTLARLAAYGFDVPAGMAVAVAAYRRWIAASGLEPELLAAAALPVAERASVLEALCERLRGVRPDADLEAALRRSLARPAWQDVALAVRSSSPQEDSATASFAGIHVSHLNVRGEAAVSEALVSVWISLWSPSAVAYRERLGIAQADASMAVLIMPLVAAEASGIAFSSDPISGRDDRMVLHANWGLGESLVGGQAVGDEIVLTEDRRDTGLLLSDYRPGGKAVQSVARADGGTEQVGSTPEQSGRRVLSDEQALRLGELIRQAALALDFTRPFFDCEWAWDGRRFWLLQARPITVRGRCTYPELQGQPDIWSRGNTRDVMPEPLSPMDWCNSRSLANMLLEEGYRQGGFALLPGAQRTGIFHGRVYLNLSLIQWEAYAAFGVKPAALNSLVGGYQPEIRVAPLGLKQQLALGLRKLRFMLRAKGMRARGEREIADAPRLTRAWRETPPPADDAGFAAEFRRQLRHGRSLRGLHFMQGSGGAALSVLLELLEADLAGEGQAVVSALLAGGAPSVTAQQSYDLTAIARLANQDPLARTWLENRREQGGDWRDLPADNPFRQAFAGFLERYGHRGIYETYMRRPRWRERPDYLLDSLAGLAGADLDALAARQRDSVAAAMARIRKDLRWWKRLLVPLLLRLAKMETNGREAARSALMSYVEPYRRLLLVLAERWRERGWLSDPDEIFLLLNSEVLAVLDGLRPGAALPTLVAERKARFEGWWHEEVPDVILEGGDSRGVEVAPVEALPQGDVFRGIPVGSGVVVGRVRVVHSPEEGRDLRHGDILVVPSTDPAWTPLFLKAGGLVMETGGFLSHGAIVAREFGIPAVVNLPGILQRLKDGEMIQVDGLAGTVSRVKS